MWEGSNGDKFAENIVRVTFNSDLIICDGIGTDVSKSNSSCVSTQPLHTDAQVLHVRTVCRNRAPTISAGHRCILLDYFCGAVGVGLVAAGPHLASKYDIERVPLLAYSL